MKQVSLILLFIVAISQAHSQKNSDDLPAEFNDVAIQAFAKLSSATKQWFINTASQHPVGQFDTAWTKKKIREKFGTGSSDPVMELFVVMMAYQKMVNKDAREDKKIARQDKDLALASKEAKLKMDNAKIDQQKKEANERADNAMIAAQTNLWIGIVSGSSAAASGFQPNNQKIATVGLTPAGTHKIDSPKTGAKSSGVIQKQVNRQEKQAATDEETKKANEDHRRAIKDAVKKLLDQMAQMKSNLNP